MEEAVSGAANAGANTSAAELAALTALFALYGLLVGVGTAMFRRTDTLTGRAVAIVIALGALGAIVVGVLAQVDAIDGTVSGVSLGPPLLFFALFVLALVFWVWMLLDCATLEPDGGSDKVTWTIIIVMTSLLGAALYYFVRRPQRRSDIGR